MIDTDNVKLEDVTEEERGREWAFRICVSSSDGTKLLWAAFRTGWPYEVEFFLPADETELCNFIEAVSELPH